LVELLASIQYSRNDPGDFVITGIKNDDENSKHDPWMPLGQAVSARFKLFFVGGPETLSGATVWWPNTRNEDYCGDFESKVQNHVMDVGS
jgi:hypothetical protein